MTDVVREATGDRVRRAMAEAGVKQTDAAAAIGITQGQLSRRLSGRIAFRVDELATIARLCRVPTASLLPEPAAEEVAA